MRNKLLSRLGYWRQRLRSRQRIAPADDVRLLRQIHERRIPRWRQFLHVGSILGRREKIVFRASLLFFLAGLIWLGAQAVSRYRAAVPEIGGRYREAVVGSPVLVNPLFASLNDVDLDIARLIYSGLMRVDGKQRIVPDLAARYTVSEDKKEYIFELRRDAVWHDGEPFTARDVIFTFNAIQSKEVNSPLLVAFQSVKVEAADDYTVKFTLNEPFTAFPNSLTVGILPEHIWADVAEDRIRLTQKNLQPIGTGPFVFDKLFKDETGYIYEYDLKRFDRYYRQPAYLAELAFKFFSSYEGELGAINALRRQEVDGLHFVPKYLKDKVERKHVFLYTLQLPQYAALFFNAKRKALLADDNLRTALSYALDKDRILRESLQGEGQVLYGPILPGFPGYNPELEKTVYSVGQANELLDKKWNRVSAANYRAERKSKLAAEWLASQTDATSTAALAAESAEQPAKQITPEAEAEIENKLNGELNEAQTFYRKDKDSALLELEIVTVASNEYQHTAELVAGFWQELGVKTNLVFVEAKDLSRQVLKNRSYDVLLYGVIVGSDPDQYPFWHSTQTEYPGLNLAGYVNRNVDTYLEEAREAVDEEKMIEAYRRFQELVIKDQPAVFLYMPIYNYAVSDKIKNVDVSRIYAPADRFADITNWYIKTKGKWSFR